MPRSVRSAEATPHFRNRLGAVFPNFECETCSERFTFHEFLGRAPAWTVLFGLSRDFGPVAATELGQCQQAQDQFARLGAKMAALAVGVKEHHEDWVRDVLAASNLQGQTSLPYPLIADPQGKIAGKLGLLDPREMDGEAAGALPGNAVFIIGPDKTVRLSTLYPARVGRSIPEVLRALRSLLITQDFVLATPVNWQEGERLIVTAGLPTSAAKAQFCNFEIQELPSQKQYLRWVDCPVVRKEGFVSPEGVPPPSPLEDGRDEQQTDDFRIELGAAFPDFPVCTTKGNFSFHEFLRREPCWTVLFSHPKDFTPVCTTEVGRMQALAADFAARGIKLIGLSCDSVAEHLEWEQDILSASSLPGSVLDFPIIADADRVIATMLGMLDPLEKDGSGLPMPARAFFVIDENMRLALSLLYPATTGRNTQEILRAIDAVLLVRRHSVATPAEWQQGERVLVPPNMPFQEANCAYRDLEVKELPSGEHYLRFASCPE